MRETATEAMTFSTDHLRTMQKGAVLVYRQQLAQLIPSTPRYRSLEQLLLSYRAK